MFEEIQIIKSLGPLKTGAPVHHAEPAVNRQLRFRRHLVEQIILSEISSEFFLLVDILKY